MADYISPTVIQPCIPVADMTPLERLVLSAIFDAEPDDHVLYFYSGDGPNDMIWLSTRELRAAIDEADAANNTTSTYVAEHLIGAAVADAEIEIEIDFSGTSWAFIFQDIFRRSSTLTHVTAVTSFTCSKMRPDGFGGLAVLITADAITSKSTEDILYDLLEQAEHGAIATAPGFGEHVLLRLREEDVRAEIAQVIGSDETLTTMSADDIADADIRAGCLAVVDLTDLTHERRVILYNAALAAIREAEDRRHASE